jgi:pyruvate,water dikinase
MIILDQHIDLNRRDVGEKALNLRRLQQAGFLVPKFVVIPAEVICKLWFEKNLKTASAMIHDLLQGHHYAVRSSALIEDQEKSSMAGVYKTRLAVTSEHLESALEDVLRDAAQKMGGDLKDFALIIQEFIEPERSGVTFTRSPDGHPSLVIESFQGRGEDLVSGSITPSREQFLWTSVPKHYQDFQQIESLWDSPQDIEWCEVNGKRYFLQTRPITTITSEQYQHLKLLDEMLPPNTDFWYEKTDLSAAVPRPSADMLSILEKIYGENGPVQQVYKKHRIAYQPSVFWKKIVGELYVDREVEMKTLFPAYGIRSTKKNGSVSFRLKSFKGLLKTLKNQFALQRMNVDDHEELFERLQELFMDESSPNTSDNAVQNFLQSYEVIFAINLKTTKAFQQLKTALGKHADLFQDLLSSSKFSEEKIFPSLDVPDHSDWKGNGLDMSDTSPFSVFSSVEYSSENLLSWWNGLSDFRRSWIATHLQRARRWQEIREYARWLTVKHVQRLRIFFTSHDVESSSLNLPSVITNLPGASISMKVVSGGDARGTLLTVDNISSDVGEVIIYSSMLSPSLAPYLSKVKGIITEQGGMLSHLAILAREKGIPVLTGVSISEVQDFLGKEIHLDAGERRWSVLESSVGAE